MPHAQVADQPLNPPPPQAPRSVKPGVCPFSTRDLVGRILMFCEQVNGIELYAYQRALAYRIIESLLLNDGASITALFSRQSGKSETLSSTALGCAILLPTLALAFPEDERLIPFAGGVSIGVYAPKQDLSGPIYIKIRDRAHSERCAMILSDPEINIQIVQSRGDSLALSNGSVISANTASESTFIEGKTHHVVLIDEAQKVSAAKVRKEIGPMLAATNGTMVKIGTAWMSRGGFHNDIQFNIAEEARTNVRNHYQFDYKQVLAEKRALYNRHKRQYEAGQRQKKPDPFHLNYEKWLRAELARLGGNEDSEEFKMNFRLLWQESRTIAIKEVTFQAGELILCESNVPKHFGSQFAGLDVAKTSDSTVLTILEVDFSQPLPDPDGARDKDGNPIYRYIKYILAWLELQGSFEKHQYNALTSFLRDFHVGFMYVDGTGMGDPVCERMGELLPHVTVEPFVYSRPSKSDLYKLYLQEWDAGRMRYPAGEHTKQTLEFQHFREQHIELEREYHGSYLVCTAPEGDGHHDDYTDSGALAVLASKQRVMPMVEVESTSAFSGSGRAVRSAYGGASSATGGRAGRYQAGRRHR